MARAIVINTYPSEDGLVRKVTIKTPVHKLVFFVQVWKRYLNVVTNVVSALILYFELLKVCTNNSKK